jgi:hypothetical protein
MMQSCALAAKLRSGKPILPIGMKAKGHVGVPPPRTIIGAPSQAYGQDRNCRGTFSNLHSLCRTQNNAVRYNALPHEPPQGDQKLARQGHDHELASAAGVLGAGAKPLRQGAVLLEHEKSPRQLNHASSKPSIARTGQPFLPAFSATLVGRAREAGIAALRPVGRACFATAPPVPACRPSRCQPRSRAPTGAPLRVVRHWAHARDDPGESMFGLLSSRMPWR